MAFLEAKNLSFRYATKDSFSLENVSFNIQKGEFILLFGETGCGKSTLLKQWKPSISPTGEKKGELRFNGKLLKELGQREEAWKIGYVSQNPDNQIVTDKVWHELAFTLENLGHPSDEIRKRVAEIAVYFGITGWFHKSVSQLSGGQKQILNLASVMIAKPELLLLDEPTSQLDPIATENFMNLLSRIHTELGTTILLAEHRLEEAYAKVDRCMVMEQGELICFDKVSQVAKYLFEEKKSAFALLPLQARLPILMKREYSIVTVGQAKRFIEENMEKASMNIENIACEKRVPVLSFQNVWFRYEKNGVDILRDFSLSIGKGDFLAIVGANGQGKSTFLQLAAGILKPYRGKVKSKASKGISLLPQNPQDLFLKSSVKEELLTVSEEIDEIAERLELTELLDKHPYDLSGGQQQMVGLAKVLLTRPEVLLLDEPTKGVDQLKKKKLGSLLQKLNRKGITIVLISHDVDFCAAYANKAGMVFDGVMTAVGERHTFFLNQYFFTTTCLKICREVYEGMIIEEEVLEYGRF
ncbi:MAG TPA: cobalt ABC transporter ATP-binding protein [Lachnospiraceae bacterium]|nr:cobalt ABC transporter ATP-binding protein [Lachnospiraceae bacterium]